MVIDQRFDFNTLLNAGEKLQSSLVEMCEQEDVGNHQLIFPAAIASTDKRTRTTVHLSFLRTALAAQFSNR